MADARTRRVKKEIQDIQNDRQAGLTIELVNDSIFHLIGSFPGPPGTCYEGGKFDVDIVVPETYPFVALKMKFLSKVYHPNISSASGAICLDILKDNWSPILTLKSTLISLQSLLCTPEPNDPQDAEVAKHYLTSKSSFEETARYWTETYARPQTNEGRGAPSGTSKTSHLPTVRDEVAMAGLERAHVEQFEALGFERGRVIEVLKRINYRGANVPKISEDTVVEELLK
ncbi:hypothetical protein BOTBODRAFT_139070 [Botryobasidium botryosum FD-172 SS1]|uniref:Ubiquitin-conjugating enzyme E2 1 n=1 Tax=Botryobasidium botryosum (strain FD-172 SS1) TaxID=930990 RepID=A0A067M117_BOTB1|nr:hypothetical protein BOTBODRAFT_139070 [Botryobasidium botryosum FD-172 SS1]